MFIALDTADQALFIMKPGLGLKN